MRHFAAELVDSNINVHYVKLDDRNNKNSLKDHVTEIIEKHSVKRVIIPHPSEYRTLQEIKQWKSILSIPIQIRELCFA